MGYRPAELASQMDADIDKSPFSTVTPEVPKGVLDFLNRTRATVELIHGHLDFLGSMLAPGLQRENAPTLEQEVSSPQPTVLEVAWDIDHEVGRIEHRLAAFIEAVHG